MSGNNPYSKDGESVRDFLDNFSQRTFERFEDRREDHRDERVAQASEEFRASREIAQEAPHGVDKAAWEEAANGARDDVEAWFAQKQEWRRQFREAYYDTLEAGLIEDKGGASRGSPVEETEYEGTDLYYVYRTPKGVTKREHIKTLPLADKK